MTRGLLGTLRNVATLPSILGLLWTLSFLSLSTSLARADQMEWSQKAGGGGGVIRTTADCGTSVACTASDGSSNRLHSAVLQSSTVLQATDGGTWRLNSGYLTTFPPRPLVQCRATLPTEDCVANGWYNDTTFDFRNDRSCATPPCAFSKGALHYYKYVFNTSATATEAAVDAGTEWSDTHVWCPTGNCNDPRKFGATVNQAIGGETSTGYYIHVNTYNGGMKGGRGTYGPFKIDQTNPSAPGWTSPATNDWFQATADTDITLTDADSGAVQSLIATCDYMVENYNAGWVTTKTYTSRNCSGTSIDVATVGNLLECGYRGFGKCRITARATDTAGNTSATSPRTFSADWLITYHNNGIFGPVTGYPASAIDSSTAYLATYVGGTDISGNPTLYALDSTASTESSCKLNDLGNCTSTTCLGVACGSTVGAPFWTYVGADNFVYVTTTNGWIFKYQRIGGTLQIAPPGANGIWPLRIADKCSGATSRSITSEPVVDDKLVYFGASEAGGTCGAGQEFIFGFEINPTIYNADVGGDNKADEIVGVPGCGTTAKGVPTIRGTWPAAKFLHIGGDCSSKEIYRVKVDANNADCWRNLAGISSVEGWMTGPSGKLFFGTATGTIQLHALNNTESTALCPDPPVAGTDPYADLTGFPFAHGGTAVKRGAIMNSQSDLDEVYFVDDNGSMYCVCQIQGSSAARGCPTVGASCKKNDGATNFTVAVGGGGTPLREPLRDTATGTLYVLTNKAKVYAYESLYDPAGGGTCGAGEYTNCDGTNPGTEVGAAQGYPFDLGDNGVTITAASTVALRNVGGAKLIAVGTDSGRVFYLPIVP